MENESDSRYGDPARFQSYKPFPQPSDSTHFSTNRYDSRDPTVMFPGQNESRGQQLQHRQQPRNDTYFDREIENVYSALQRLQHHQHQR